MTDNNTNTGPSSEIQTYYVAINDMFAVPGHEVDSAEEAEQYVLERIGQQGWLPYEAEVIDTEPLQSETEE